MDIYEILLRCRYLWLLFQNILGKVLNINFIKYTDTYNDLYEEKKQRITVH